MSQGQRENGEQSNQRLEAKDCLNMAGPETIKTLDFAAANIGNRQEFLNVRMA